jgi:calcineurin-like phosphoesterase family protein
MVMKYDYFTPCLGKKERRNLSHCPSGSGIKPGMTKRAVRQVQRFGENLHGQLVWE